MANTNKQNLIKVYALSVASQLQDGVTTSDDMQSVIGDLERALVLANAVAEHFALSETVDDNE